MNFNTIRSEGALISADLLSAIQSAEVYGQKSVDFELDGKMVRPAEWYHRSRMDPHDAGKRTHLPAF